MIEAYGEWRQRRSPSKIAARPHKRYDTIYMELLMNTYAKTQDIVNKFKKEAGAADHNVLMQKKN